MGDFLPRTLMNYHEKFDAASFILGGEIYNCTNIHKKVNNQQTNCNTMQC